VAIHSSGQPVFSSSYVEGITLGVVEVGEVARGSSDMSVDRISEVGNWTSEGQVAGVYGAGFTAGSLARKGARDGTGNKGSSEKELTEIRMMAEGD
jgi:hypothetical protein